MGDLTIYTLGDAGFLRDVFNSLKMYLYGSGLYMPMIGFIFGLILYGFKSFLTGSFEYGYLVGTIFLSVILFSSEKQTFIEDYSTGAVHDVGEVPLAIALPFSLITRIGRDLTTGLEITFQPPSNVVGTSSGGASVPTFTGTGFLGPLRSIMNSRNVGLPTNYSEATALNEHGRFTKTFTSYINDCFIPYAELPEFNKSPLDATEIWSELEVPITSWPATSYLTESVETKACNEIYQDLSSVVNSGAYIEQIVSVIASKSGRSISDVRRDFDWFLGNTSDAETFMRNYTVRHAVSVASKYSNPSFSNSISSIMEAEAISKRQVSAGVEAALFMEKATTILAFIEGFIVFSFPVFMMLVMIGSYGSKTIIGYLTALMWINLWPVSMLIVHNYTFKAISDDFAASGLSDSTSWASMDSIFTTSASWMATSSELIVAVPALAAFLLAGSLGVIMGVAGISSSVASSAASTGSPDTPKMKNGSYSFGPYRFDKMTTNGSKGMYKTFNGPSNSFLADSSLSSATGTTVSKGLDAVEQRAKATNAAISNTFQRGITTTLTNSATTTDGWSTTAGIQDALQHIKTNGWTSAAGEGSNKGISVAAGADPSAAMSGLIAGAAVFMPNATNARSELFKAVGADIGDKKLSDLTNAESKDLHNKLNSYSKKGKSPLSQLAGKAAKFLSLATLNTAISDQQFVQETLQNHFGEGVNLSSDKYKSLASMINEQITKVGTDLNQVAEQKQASTQKVDSITSSTNQTAGSIQSEVTQLTNSFQTSGLGYIQRMEANLGLPKADAVLESHYKNSGLEQTLGASYEQFIKTSTSSYGDGNIARANAFQMISKAYAENGKFGDSENHSGPAQNTTAGRDDTLEALYEDLGISTPVLQGELDEIQQKVDSFDKANQKLDALSSSLNGGVDFGKESDPVTDTSEILKDPAEKPDIKDVSFGKTSELALGAGQSTVAGQQELEGGLTSEQKEIFGKDFDFNKAFKRVADGIHTNSDKYSKLNDDTKQSLNRFNPSAFAGTMASSLFSDFLPDNNVEGLLAYSSKGAYTVSSVNGIQTLANKPITIGEAKAKGIAQEVEDGAQRLEELITNSEASMDSLTGEQRNDLNILKDNLKTYKDSKQGSLNSVSNNPTQHKRAEAENHLFEAVSSLRNRGGTTLSIDNRGANNDFNHALQSYDSHLESSGNLSTESSAKDFLNQYMETSTRRQDKQDLISNASNAINISTPSDQSNTLPSKNRAISTLADIAHDGKPPENLNFDQLVEAGSHYGEIASSFKELGVELPEGTESAIKNQINQKTEAYQSELNNIKGFEDFKLNSSERFKSQVSDHIFSNLSDSDRTALLNTYGGNGSALINDTMSLMAESLDSNSGLRGFFRDALPTDPGMTSGKIIPRGRANVSSGSLKKLSNDQMTAVKSINSPGYQNLSVNGSNYTSDPSESFDIFGFLKSSSDTKNNYNALSQYLTSGNKSSSFDLSSMTPIQIAGMRAIATEEGNNSVLEMLFSHSYNNPDFSPQALDNAFINTIAENITQSFGTEHTKEIIAALKSDDGRQVYRALNSAIQDYSSNHSDQKLYDSFDTLKAEISALASNPGLGRDNQRKLRTLDQTLDHAKFTHESK